MGKGESKWMFKWIGLTWLGSWLWMCSILSATAQIQVFDSLQMGSVWWWGDLDQWTLNIDADQVAEDPLWTLDATSEGPHVICGCRPGIGNSEQVEVHWRQQVYGSNANSSQLFYAVVEGDSAVASARQLGLSALVDTLTMGVRLSAGESGSSDSLRVQRPGAPALALDGGCHNWGSPFELDGLWQPLEPNAGQFSLQDREGRILNVVQHTFDAAADTSMVCLGLRVTRTASHGQRWSFGWRPLSASPSEAELKLTLDGPQILEGQIFNAFQFGAPEVVLHQEWSPSQPQPQDMMPQIPGVQSMVPWEVGSCSNTWTATLPQPVAPGGAVRFSHLEDTLVVWRDGSSVLVPGDLAFTEVMADPTPAVHAPESTYLELVNLSSHALDPTALWLEDSGEFHTLSWPEGGSSRIIQPGACWLIVDDDEPWPLGVEDPIVVKASSWSGLRDDGESVAIVGPQGELERVTFHKSWWGDTPQDGVSVSTVTPSSCDHPSTWRPDPAGASPGRLAWPEYETEHLVETTLMDLWMDDHLHIHLKPHLAWDNRTAPKVHILDGQSLQAFHAIPVTGEGWVLEGLTARPSSNLHIHVEETAACEHPLRILPMDTTWTAHRPAQRGDIQLSEVLSEHHPVVDAEFVEWLNISEDTLSWGRTCWPPGQTLVESNLPKAHFASWIPTEWLEHPGLWVVQEDLRLINSTGQVTLHRPDGLTVASSRYSECGFSRPEDLGQGKSAVWGDFGWHTSYSPWGMSPGWLELSVDSNQAVQPIPPKWGIHLGHWLMVLPEGIDENELQAECWSPVTGWQLDWLQGLRVLRSVLPRKAGSPPPLHRSQASWSFPAELGNLPEPSLVQAHWNEVLASPKEGYDSFLEVHTLENSGTTSSWFWSSNDWPNADDFMPVSEVTWRVAAQAPICFARCPARVNSSHASCLPANLPSLHGTKTLSLLAAGELDEVTSPADGGEHAVGRSWMRVGNSHAWGMSPSRPGATPGEANLLVASTLSPGSRSSLSCLTPTLAPFGAYGPTTALFQWNHLSSEAPQVSAVKYGVLNPLWGEVILQDETWATEGKAMWVWDGTTSDGNIVAPGTYVAWAQPLVEGAWQSVEKCLVAVRVR